MQLAVFGGDIVDGLRLQPRWSMVPRDQEMPTWFQSSIVGLRIQVYHEVVKQWNPHSNIELCASAKKLELLAFGHGCRVAGLQGYKVTWLDGYMVGWLHGCRIFGRQTASPLPPSPPPTLTTNSSRTRVPLPPPAELCPSAQGRGLSPGSGNRCKHRCLFWENRWD